MLPTVGTKTDAQQSRPTAAVAAQEAARLRSSDMRDAAHENHFARIIAVRRTLWKTDRVEWERTIDRGRETHTHTGGTNTNAGCTVV